MLPESPQNVRRQLATTGGYKTKTEDRRPKNEDPRFAFINKFDQGLRFVHNPTKSTKRRPLQNRLEITSKWFERDCRPKQKQETTRFAVITTRWEIQDTYFQAVIYYSAD